MENSVNKESVLMSIMRENKESSEKSTVNAEKAQNLGAEGHFNELFSLIENATDEMIVDFFTDDTVSFTDEMVVLVTDDSVNDRHVCTS